MPLLLKTHTKKPWYVTWACDTEVTNTKYHYPAGSCRGWAGRASHQRLFSHRAYENIASCSGFLPSVVVLAACPPPYRDHCLLITVPLQFCLPPPPPPVL